MSRTKEVMVVGGPVAGQRVVLHVAHGGCWPATLYVQAPRRGLEGPGPWWRYDATEAGEYVWDGAEPYVG